LQIFFPENLLPKLLFLPFPQHFPSKVYPKVNNPGIRSRLSFRICLLQTAPIQIPIFPTSLINNELQGTKSKNVHRQPANYILYLRQWKNEGGD
jgi:hypothetical protein